MTRALRRLSALAFLAATVTVSCGLTTDGITNPPPASARLALGMGVHGSPAPVLAWLKQTGIAWVRLTYYYQTVGDSAWTASLAQQLEELHANGQSVDLVVHSTPWNDPDGVGIPHAVAELLRQHPGEIGAVELYNEENVGASYWLPILPGDSAYARGQAYAARYQAMRDTVRALYPLLQVPVVSGGTAGGPEPFLRGVRDAGVRPDIVAVHAYGYPPQAELDAYVADAERVFPGVPVWATEVGSEGGRTESTTLALDIGGIFAWMRDHPAVRVFWTCAWGDRADEVLAYDTFTPRAGTDQIRREAPYR